MPRPAGSSGFPDATSTRSAVGKAAVPTVRLPGREARFFSPAAPPPRAEPPSGGAGGAALFLRTAGSGRPALPPRGPDDRGSGKDLGRRALARAPRPAKRDSGGGGGGGPGEHKEEGEGGAFAPDSARSSSVGGDEGDGGGGGGGDDDDGQEPELEPKFQSEPALRDGPQQCYLWPPIFPGRTHTICFN